jgi:hypothetical protein
MPAPRLFRLAEAAKMLSPDGKVTVRALRTEARRGRLRLMRIGGADYTTEEALAAFVESAVVPVSTPCRVDDCQPASTCGEAATIDPAPSSSWTERARLAQAQALMSVEKLKMPSPTTSPKTIDPRVVRIGRTNS